MSIVRDNLMNEPGYTPYCGAERCRARWPRTRFNGSQFQCSCGWQSGFEAAFIEQYKNRVIITTTGQDDATIRRS